ncbi:MAG: DUF1501 domain-containing protein [Bacteroidales bacterium]|nr:DUF1501 domain-containing protein [Bacteroidales bacterium]
MDRRKFIKRLGAASAGPILLNGIPFNALAANSPLMKMLAASDSDRVLVFLQLHGGNDGLNTIIPIANYNDYYAIRANIAIPNYGSRKYLPLDDSLPENDKLGLHPSMTGVKELYDQHRAAVVQAVGYDNMNLSHFRGRDIWFMGGDYDERIPSGWMGRFLDQEYPGYPDGYPNADMPDPLGLELGDEVTLAFQRENSIPAGISLSNPDAFYNLINSVGVEPPSPSFPDSYYGDELEYLMNFEIKTNDYAGRLKQVYDAGHNSPNVTYPEVYPLNAPTPYIQNHLSEQFKIIARLLSGGIKTRIFLTRITGFDTHADQVETFDTTQGRHAALLYHISESVKAFHNDLKDQGIDDKVLTMTFSEFGRRAASNGSYGTDHGKAAPILLFGSGLKGGVYGTNPDLNNLDGGNIRHEFDYRQVYTTVLSDWLGSPNSAIGDTGFGDYLDKKLDLIANPLAVYDVPEYNGKSKLNSCFPNPATDYTKIGYYLSNDTPVILRLYTSSGKMVKELVNQNQTKGEYQIDVNVFDLQSGNYIYKIQAGEFTAAKIMFVD